MDDQKTINLYASIAPILEAGAYTISTKQEITGNENLEGKEYLNKNLTKTEKTFEVKGEKWAINPSDIASVYPGKNACGDFTDELPYITFYRESLPWIRRVSKDNSWMALLLLPIADEPSKQGWKILTRTIAERIEELKDKIKNGKIDKKENELKYNNEEGNCRILTINETKGVATETKQIDIKKIKEYFKVSSLFCHVREVDVRYSQITTDYKKEEIKDGKKKKSIVIGSQCTLKQGKYEAHLVSLEHLDLESDNLELTSLYSWAFEHKKSGHDTFERLGKKLVKDKIQKELLYNNIQDDLAIKEQKIGAVEKSVFIEKGENKNKFWGKNFYSGVLSPNKEELDDSFSKIILELEPNKFHHKNVEDVFKNKSSEDNTRHQEKWNSYLIAWQLGRMLALSDKRFLTAKQLLKNTHHQGLLNQLHLRNSNHTFIRNKIDSHNTKETLKLNIDREVLKGRSANNIVNKEVNKNTDSFLKITSLEEIKKKKLFSYEEMDTNNNQANDGKKENQPHEFNTVAEFISDIYLLKNIPFPYLVLDKKMLPEDSLKFFYVDPLWIECVIKGAFSIGYHPVIHKDFMDTHFNTLKDKGKSKAIEQRELKLGVEKSSNSTQLCGFLLRSKLVTYFPQKQIKAINKKKEDINPVHIEQKGNDLLLVLFNEVPGSIKILESDHGLRFKINKAVFEKTLLRYTTEENKEMIIIDLVKELTAKRQYIGL